MLLAPEQQDVRDLLDDLCSPLRTRYGLVLGPSHPGHTFAGDAGRVAKALYDAGYVSDNVIKLVGEDATFFVSSHEKD